MTGGKAPRQTDSLDLQPFTVLSLVQSESYRKGKCRNYLCWKLLLSNKAKSRKDKP